MPNADAHLSGKIFTDSIEKAATRDGFGTGVVEAGKADERVVVLSADLAESTRADAFAKEFPNRFVEVGVSEQNLAALASGMAAGGKVPFITSFAVFSPGRNYEQIRTTIAINARPVKICGMHAGISVGEDGATHQMLEDIGMMRMLPGMTVIVPADAEEAKKATIAAAKIDGPVYLRFGRIATPTFTTSETPFVPGKALPLWAPQSPDTKPHVAIFSTGSVSYAALQAARALSESGIESLMIHVPTIKPLDEMVVLDAAFRSTCVVTVEEHMIAGGFGSTIAEFLSEKCPMPILRIGVQDRFGQSGTPDELLAHYGLNATHIEDAIRAFCPQH